MVFFGQPTKFLLPHYLLGLKKVDFFCNGFFRATDKIFIAALSARTEKVDFFCNGFFRATD